MADWTLVPCLAQLRREFDSIAPFRKRASDGSVGDAAHAGAGTSDHLPDEDFPRLRDKDSDRLNEVHAIDVDVNLAVPGLSMEDVVQHLLARCRAGTERRLRYIIYNRRIWEASNGWRQEPYGGGNPHDKHAHFSASYRPELEASTAPFGLADLLKKEEPVALTQADIDAIWSKDINASPTGSNRAYTTVFSIFQTVNSLAATVAGLVTSVAALGGTLTRASNQLDALTADPAETGEAHPLVQAYRYVQANPAPPA